MKKDSHLAWNVKYAPGAIEARGFKDGKQVLTAKRETTGPAAKLVLRADRPEIAADGEDVAMFAVEVQDAQGSVRATRRQSGGLQRCGPGGRLIGVGNGRAYQPRIRQRRSRESLLRTLHGDRAGRPRQAGSIPSK